MPVVSSLAVLTYDLAVIESFLGGIFNGEISFIECLGLRIVTFGREKEGCIVDDEIIPCLLDYLLKLSVLWFHPNFDEVREEYDQ